MNHVNSVNVSVLIPIFQLKLKFSSGEWSCEFNVYTLKIKICNAKLVNTVCRSNIPTQSRFSGY